jgi:DNA ligase D-like protein (predicted polymerase)
VTDVVEGEERDGVRLTSLDSALGDGLDVAKRDLVDHLDAFADRIVPLLAGRPLSIVRVRPGQAPFMQKNVVKGAPDWVRTVPVWAEASHREVHHVLCDDRRTLLWLANQRAVEFHVPFFRVGDAGPRGIVLDLDPPEGADFGAVVATAELVRRALDDVGLAGAVKTSGAKGVHVVVPVREATFDDAAAATRALAVRAERFDPELATTAYIKDERGGRVFVDSTRAYSATLVAAYSPRVRPGLPVSAPVPWDELGSVRPGDVTVRTAARRLAEGDAWAELLPEPQVLPADLVAEGHTIPVARVAAMHEGRRRKRAAEKAAADDPGT